MIKETTGEITLVARNIPEELVALDQWVCWCLEERDEKLTKVPYNPHTGGSASTTESTTWTTSVAVVAAYERGECDGIGFVFSGDDPYTGIDLDKCRDPENGEIAPWAQDILERMPEGYIEVSPSGRGIHIIVRGAVRGGGMRKGSVEMYSRGRFFTVTGGAL